MTLSEIRTLINKLSKEDCCKVFNAIRLLEEDSILALDYIENALELTELINNLKEKYEKNN